MKAMQLALSLGMDKRFLIETPLMWIDKAETWELAQSIGGEKLVDLIIEHTHTCDLGDVGAVHDGADVTPQQRACQRRLADVRVRQQGQADSRHRIAHAAARRQLLCT